MDETLPLEHRSSNYTCYSEFDLQTKSSCMMPDINRILMVHGLHQFLNLSLKFYH